MNEFQSSLAGRLEIRLHTSLNSAPTPEVPETDFSPTNYFPLAGNEGIHNRNTRKIMPVFFRTEP
jgi:hypothetical protein